jgi:hypothetical protein
MKPEDMDKFMNTILRSVHLLPLSLSHQLTISSVSPAE